MSNEKLCLTAICILSASLMLWAAWTDSAVNDETVYIPAGYIYITHFTYNLNPEHPPLIKAIASAPTIFLKPNLTTSSLTVSNPTINQWAVGDTFLYQSGNNADMIVRIARLVPIGITILTIIFIYLLSSMLMGPWLSLVPSFLFALDPTILGNGHLATNDVGAAFGVVIATYYFLQHWITRSTKSLWFAGIAFGIAQLTKFSAIILIPFFFLLYFVQEKKTKFLLDLIYIFLIGYGIVYAVYTLFTLNYPIAQQVADTIATLHYWLGSGFGLGSIDIWMAGNPIFRPFAQYILGLLIITSHTTGGVFVYAFGKVSLGGGWWYFPAIFILKEPIPILIIIAIALILGLKHIILSSRNAKKSDTPSNRPHHAFFILALSVFITMYWCISMASPLDHGIRYIIPTLPFIYIFAAYAWSIWLKPGRTAGFAVLSCLLLWLLVEIFFTAPYFLSYYNEFGDGTWNGYQWATDSNYDWGQDLLRFQSFMDQHPEISSIAVGNLGRDDVHYYLGARAIDWSSAQGNPANSGIHWFAISVDALGLATQPTGNGVTRDASSTYGWLTALRPPQPGMGNVPEADYRVGTSIFVYHL